MSGGSPESALLGEPPATHDDVLIIKALTMLNGSAYLPVPNPSYADSRPPNEWNGYHFLGLTISLMILVILVTVARFGVRWKGRKKHKSFILADIFVVPAALTALAYDSILLYMVKHYCLGRHVNYCSYKQLAGIYQTLFIDQTIFYFAVYTAKLSIVFFNRRLMESTFGWWRRANDILLCVVIVFAIWSLLSTILICIPVPPHYSLFALANSDPRTFRCLNADAVQNANRGLHIASDLCLLSFPIILLCRLRISWVRKSLLIFLFLFGLVTVLASIMRNIVVPQTGMDLSWSLWKVSLWDSLDINFSPTVASLPSLVPLFDTINRSIRRLLDIKSTANTGSDSGSRKTDRSKSSDQKSKSTDLNYLLHAPECIGGCGNDFEDFGAVPTTYASAHEGEYDPKSGVFVGPSGLPRDRGPDAVERGPVIDKPTSGLPTDVIELTGTRKKTLSGAFCDTSFLDLDP